MAGVSVEQVDIGVCRIVDGPDVALDLNNLKHTASLYFLPLVGDLIGSWGRPIQAWFTEPFVTALNFCKEGVETVWKCVATTQNCERAAGPKQAPLSRTVPPDSTNATMMRQIPCRTLALPTPRIRRQT